MTNIAEHCCDSLAGILGYCAQMGVDTILYSLDLGMLFWLVLGMGVAAMRNMDAKNRNDLKPSASM